MNLIGNNWRGILSGKQPYIKTNLKEADRQIARDIAHMLGKAEQ